MPHGVENRFEYMGEINQPFESEDAGTALDRVHRAEHRMHGVLRAAAIRQVGEPCLHVLEQLATFVEECALQLVQTCHGR